CLQRTAFLPVVSRGALHPISLLLCDGTATSAICTLSLHDALPIWVLLDFWWATDEGPLWTQTSGQEVVFFVARSDAAQVGTLLRDRKSTRLNSSHVKISYAVFCLKKQSLLKFIRMNRNWTMFPFTL